MKLTCGTGIYVDFPTSKGNIYTKQAVTDALRDEVMLSNLRSGKMLGGLMTNDEHAGDVFTHIVRNIYVYKDEIVVDYEVLNNPEALRTFSILKRPEAVIIMMEKNNLSGILTKLDRIRTVHLREKKVYVPSPL